MKTTEKLFHLKDKVERAGKRIERIKGEENGIKITMKKEFDVTTVAQAKALLKKKTKLKETKEKSLKAEVEKLEEANV